MIGLLEGPPRSILVVMLSAVGDAVMVLPVLEALRRAFPDTFITWVIQENPYELVAGHRAVDDFVLFRRDKRLGRIRSAARGLESLRDTTDAIRRHARGLPSGRFDLLLGLQVYFKAGLLCALAPARIKLGFDLRRARDLNWLFTTHRIPSPPGRFAHVQDQYFEFLRAIGVDPEPVRYGLGFTQEERSAQQRFFSRMNRPACAIVVATSNPMKDWNAPGYAAVASGVRERFGLQPILVGGSSPAERSMAEAILARGGGSVVDARAPGLRRLLWLLDGSRVVISPDTGPLHMARALGVPVVGLFGHTNPKRSGPYRMFQDLIVDGYARYPGEEYELTPRRRPDGMGRVTANRVLDKVALALARYPPRR